MAEGRLYPLFVHLAGMRCLVVGGGKVAERKVRGLLAAGAVIRLVAPVLTPGLLELVEKAGDQIVWEERFFCQADIDGVTLVFAATDDPEQNRMICLACRQKGILANGATGPEAGTFLVPAVVDRGRLQIAVSTSGASPAVAKKVRQALEAYFPEAFDQFLAWMEKAREVVKTHLDQQPQREQHLNRLADSALLDLLKAGKQDEAEALFQDWVNQVLSARRISSG